MAKVLLVYPNLMLVNQLPNNIPILASCLKKNRHEVKVFDTTFYHTSEKSNDEIRVERMQVRKFNINDVGIKMNLGDVYEDFKKLVNAFMPNLIAVTVVEDTIEMAVQLVASQRELNIPVVFGGVYATLCPEEVLGHNEVDYVCVGEGEEALNELACTVEKNIKKADIKGIWRKDKNGNIKKTSMRDPVDINHTPFEDFSVFSEDRIFRPMQGKMVAALPINFDRGCPYKCTFCAAPSLTKLYSDNCEKKYFRKKSIKRIKEELEYYLKELNVNYLYFNSETFLSMPNHQLEEFADMYHSYKIPFWCQTHVQTVNEHKVKILKNIGIDRISLGIEHGNEEFRKKMLKKNYTNAQALNAMRLFHKYDIPVSVNNMIGYPDENRQLVFETIELNRQLKADGINGFVFQPYKGTYLYDYCFEKGYIKEGKSVDSPIGSSVLEMPSMSAEEIEGLLRTFVLYVKLPRKYWDKISEAEQLTEKGDKALGELRELLFNKYF